MPRKRSPYGPRYERVRRAQLGQPCQMRLVCDGAPATSTDHDPPLSRHRHVEGSGCCRMQPACWACQQRQRVMLAGQTARFRKLGLPLPDLTPVVESSRSWL